ncbi:MAG: hypothetical protein IT305_09885 [Chloroflexi bacterium]|nr:hypothetical protein [Chloroflexota bacterium]
MDDVQAAQGHLQVLRDGTPDEQIAARTALAAIFERRGQLQEAVELYEANARSGVREPALFDNLARLYRRLDRPDRALDLLPAHPSRAGAETPDMVAPTPEGTRVKARLAAATGVSNAVSDTTPRRDAVSGLSRAHSRAADPARPVQRGVTDAVRRPGGWRARTSRGAPRHAYPAALRRRVRPWLPFALAAAGVVVVAGTVWLVLSMLSVARPLTGIAAESSAQVATPPRTSGQADAGQADAGQAAQSVAATPVLTATAPVAGVAAAEAATPTTDAGVASGLAPAASPPSTTVSGLPPQESLAQLSAERDVCVFRSPFAEMRVRVGPDQVGDCVENAVEPAGSDLRQRTTRGELVHRSIDGRIAFTNGVETWIDGPNGVQKRPNHERFDWEPAAVGRAAATPTPFPLPPALPGSIFPSRRIVSYYGNPLAATMGILGELPSQQVIAKLRAQAQAYADVDPSRPVVPALELVAVVAQAGPGADGLYRLRMGSELIADVIRQADANGFLVILDVQIGRGNVDDEVRFLLPFLERPNVHLALDPEFAMPPGQVPGQRIGTMDAAAINGAIRTLSDLVTAKNLPPKLLVVHRFTAAMVTNVTAIETDPKVQVAIVMDGFGSPALKTRPYDELIAGDQRVQYTGFKLFYRHDVPLMSPADVLRLTPPPDLIVYQ